MELSVGNKPNAHPTSDDIERAIDETPKPADWHLHLQSNGDDDIEAFAEADGRYRVTFTEQGRRFNAASPVGADTAKAIFVDYLNGDTDWRRNFRYVPEPSRGSRSRASRRISSEPPVWAVIVVAAAFFGFPALALLPESWRARLPAGSGIVWLVAGPIVVMALAMLVNKMLQARRATVWPQAAGRITRSEVGANYRRPSGRPVELINYPAIEYEYSVAGQSFTGRRISIGEDSGGANTEATLAHYPLGATVMVYYDPDDPGSCVLEREVPKQVPLGCAAILAILAALGYGGYWLFNHFHGVVEPYLEDGKGRTVIFTIVGGLVALMLFTGSRLGAKAGSDWPVVRGKVVLSRTERYRARASRTAVTSYAPVVEYAYTVNGHEYRSRQIQLDDDGGGESGDDAKKLAARYPEGSEVEVHYDPANPGSAALEKPGGPAWYLLGIAVLCFGAAAYAGLFWH
jgi:hypothetical protein